MRQYLFVAIDDFCRELYAAILPDKTQGSARKFLQQVLDECPYTIEQYYTDNGKEYKGDPRHHRVMLLCAQYGIEQRFTRVRTPRTNGKAELRKFVNFYKTVRPHKGIDGMTPEEKLIAYFYPEKL